MALTGVPAHARVEGRIRYRPAHGDLRRIRRLFARHGGRRRTFVAALLLLVAEATTAILEPWPVAYLIDFLLGKKQTPVRLFNLSAVLTPRAETVLVLTGAIVLLAMINSAADSWAEITLARGGRVLGYNLQVALFQHLRKLSLSFHDRLRIGDAVTRVTGDVTVLEEFVTESVSDMAGSVLLLLGTLGFIIYRSWQVAIVAVLIVPVLAIVSLHYSGLIKSASRRGRAREGELASVAQEMLTSIRVVQTYGHADFDTARFAAQSSASMKAALDVAAVEARFSWVTSQLEALAVASVVWVGLWLIDRGTITLGGLVFYILLLRNMFKPTRTIIREWYTIGKVHASAERVADVLDRTPAVLDRPDAEPAPAFRGRIALAGVTFGYRADSTDQLGAGLEVAGHVVLHDVSFEVEAGQVFAILGASGAGKSTIAQLVPRLYDPDSGSVLIDGTDIRRFTLDSLRAQISLVLQESLLFSGTVAENISYGLPDAGHPAIVAAARQANADGFIRRLPDGYDTVLGERGATLSGGQRQRIAIARAFIRNPPILILDEPTTGLDRDSTRLVVEALATLMRGKTTIVISHDPSLLRFADRGCVVDEGRIVQTGPVETLLARGASPAALRVLGPTLAGPRAARGGPA